jgi:hypothetical protein
MIRDGQNRMCVYYVCFRHTYELHIYTYVLENLPYVIRFLVNAAYVSATYVYVGQTQAVDR